EEDDFLSLPMFTPFSAERIGYFARLLQFDWSQYSTGREQAGLYEDEEPPPLPAPPQAVEPVQQIATSPTTAAAIEIRRLARAAIQTSPVPAAAPEPSGTLEAPVVRPEGAQVTLGEDYSIPERSDWRPGDPPQLDGIDEIELDCETNGLRWWAGDLPIGISIRRPDGRTQYLPWGHRAGGNLDEEVVKRWAQRELRGKKITNINSRFDNHFLYAWGVDLEEQDCHWEDVAHWAALLDEYRKEFGLDVLAQDFLGQAKTPVKLDKNKMAEYHAGQVAEYACQDVHLIGGLKGVMIPLMAEQNLERVRQLESDLIFPVCEMERNAAHIDRSALQE
ncbi:hypothetical protein LCGC14_3164260, partial [marine sediment metagenome]